MVISPLESALSLNLPEVLKLLDWSRQVGIFSRFQLIDWEFASMGNPARDVGVVVAMLLAFHYFHMLQPVNNSQHRRTAYNLQECCVKFGMAFHYALLKFTCLLVILITLSINFIVHAYLQEVSLNDEEQKEFTRQVAGMAGAELAFRLAY